ncbi:Clavaminate synthase-like protein [Artomyces pyxidatus]|uniref:Clavaminate synthase-like protein n=1 Tax=Artomyces pyxidatus TaxID=48021 RepID=A0ACB8T1J6_9AGAM|nr:Clavaminate synthase-like protein [Artomyces pyxidatus]
MPGTVLPPFPDDVPTVPLLIIDYSLIKEGDAREVDRLWQAATELGFWYLKNHGAEEEADAMFDTGEATLNLPLEEKMKFEPGEHFLSFGYKHAGWMVTDKAGNPDSVEFMSVSKDDILARPAVANRTYPTPVEASMDSSVRPFTIKAIEITGVLFSVLGDRLGLPKGMLASVHRPDERSGSEARFLKVAGSLNCQAPPEKASLGAHTDYGSFSFLHNRLGGLQVFPLGSDGWKYVKPIPGHAICNIGDAMNIFSGGILRSNVHRIVPPPKEQAAYDRWSLVYFTRPGDSVPLEPLSEQSAMIADAVAKAPAGKYNTGTTAKGWFARRVRNVQLTKFTGPQTWQAGKGTEHQEF